MSWPGLSRRFISDISAGHSGARARAREPGIQKPASCLHLDSGSGADAPSRNDKRAGHGISTVMAGLVPAIYVFHFPTLKSWMPGIEPGMTRKRD